MIRVNDDLISLDSQRYIKKLLLSDTFPWYYKYGTVFDGDMGGESIRKYNPLTSKEIHWFSHKFVNQGNIESPYFDDIRNNFIVPFMAYNHDTGYVLDRCQANLVPPQASKFEYRHTPWHVDNECQDHMVIIYYVGDHSARTVFKNGQSVQPKQGRAVEFSGDMLHGAQIPKRRSALTGTNWYSQIPSEEMRCVINFNFVKL